ncbi:MAG: DUF2490 domain-containing protein [Bryobacterales bacterium]|nr:DUF2490 domain-containing protein [Bryobacterales bacterium]
MLMFARAVLVSLIWASALPAQELFSWHWFEANEHLTKKYDLRMTFRLRTRHEFQFVDQILGGPTLQYRAQNRVLYFAGYWTQPGHEDKAPWVMGHRTFAGAERRWDLHRTTLVGRFTWERHFGGGRDDHNRFRFFNRVLFGRKAVAPFLQYEWIGMRVGFFSSRQTGGVRFRLHPQVTVDASYLYDVRRASWGGPRSALITTVSFQRGEREARVTKP